MCTLGFSVAVYSVPQESTARACGKFLCDFLRNAVVFQSDRASSAPTSVNNQLWLGLEA